MLSESPTGKVDVILIGTGSEVSVVVDAQAKLAEEGIGARVVSMPSWQLFDKQPLDYQESVLPPDITARVAVEAGISMGWQKYVGDKGQVVSLDHYGASAPYQILMEKFGFTADNVAACAKAVLGK